MAGDIHLTEQLTPLVGVLEPRPPRPYQRPDDGSDELSDQVDSIPWCDWIDGDHRLIDTGTIDACGCPVYHWHGSENAKSATMHDGCDNRFGAHIWSATMQHDLGVGDHVSRLQLAAALRGVGIVEAAADHGIRLGPQPLPPLTPEHLTARAEHYAAIGDAERAARFHNAAATLQSDLDENAGTARSATNGATVETGRVAGGTPAAPTIEIPGEQPDGCPRPADTAGSVPSGSDSTGEGESRAVPPDNIDELFANLADPYDPQLEAAVFDFLPQTQLIRDRARATRVSPWAVLGTTIARGLLRVSPGTMLPPLVGSGAAPLNLQLGIVGPSGKGKDAARHVVGYTATVDEGWDQIFCPPSGAALASLFVDWLPNADGKLERTQIREAAWCDWSEVDTLTVTAKRGGNDLSSQLRVAISGGRLGSDPKMERKAPITVDPLTYRIVVSFSVQYGQPAEALLAEKDGGTLQRTLWMGASDPLAPRKRPAKPEGQLDILAHLSHAQPWLTVDSDVAEEIDEARWSYLSRDGGEDTREGHRGLITLRVAAWAALVQGREQITMREWSWASQVMVHSDRVYARIVASVRGLKSDAAKEQGELDLVRRQATETAASAHTEKLLDGLAAWGAGRTGTFTMRDIKRSVSTRDARYRRAQELSDELVARGVWGRDGNHYWPL